MKGFFFYQLLFYTVKNSELMRYRCIINLTDIGPCKSYGTLFFYNYVQYTKNLGEPWVWVISMK